MKLIAATVAATLMLSLPAPASANAQVEAAQACFSDSTSGRDRKLLGKWIFLAIAAHPEISRLSAATAAEKDQTSRDFAELFTRLVTEDCTEEMRALAAAGSSESIRVAFEHLGKLAMLELMSAEPVSGAIADFEKHLDAEKIGRALNPAN